MDSVVHCFYRAPNVHHPAGKACTNMEDEVLCLGCMFTFLLVSWLGEVWSSGCSSKVPSPLLSSSGSRDVEYTPIGSLQGVPVLLLKMPY